jgi:hypothetical protein
VTVNIYTIKALNRAIQLKECIVNWTAIAELGVFFFFMPIIDAFGQDFVVVFF